MLIDRKWRKRLDVLLKIQLYRQSVNREIDEHITDTHCLLKEPSQWRNILPRSPNQMTMDIPLRRLLNK